MPASLAYLLLSWGIITTLLIVVVIYRAVLSAKEDDQLYLNKAESAMMGAEQQEIISRLQRLGLPITILAVLSGVLLLTSAGLWMWIGFNNF